MLFALTTYTKYTNGIINSDLTRTKHINKLNSTEHRKLHTCYIKLITYNLNVFQNNFLLKEWPYLHKFKIKPLAAI